MDRRRFMELTAASLVLTGCSFDSQSSGRGSQTIKDAGAAIGTSRKIIHSDQAPAAIGTYSQAVQVNNTVYLSGQIPLDPVTMSLVQGDFAAQAHQVFKNLRAVCEAAGGHLGDIVKLNIYLVDLANFSIVNEVMGQYFKAPFPARAALGINQLPRGAHIEADGIMVI